jgi:S-formylglutathione hydrolase FrmB
MVPSKAMGRDIPVALQAGRPRELYLPDAFDAGPDVSNWMTAGHPTQTLAGTDFSVAARGGGADRTVE